MTTLNVRIEEKTKREAGKVLADMGLDLSTGVKIFLQQVITEKGLPFTPSKTKRSPAAIRAQWDKEVAWARKHSKPYTDVDELFKDLGIK